MVTFDSEGNIQGAPGHPPSSAANQLFVAIVVLTIVVVFCKYVLGMKGSRFVRHDRLYAEVPDSEQLDGDKNIGMINFQSQFQAY